MDLFKNKKLLIPAIAVLAVVVVVLVLLLSKQEPSEPVSTTAALTSTASTTAATIPETSAETTHQTTTPMESGETYPPAQWETTPEIEATYEQWLAAAMFLVIPLEYPDFQLEGIYAASQTELERKATSLGVYFCFQSDGAQVWIHSAPLASNRSEKGTTDLHTAQLGYASFDVVEPADVSAMTELAIADLAEPMTYTMLPGLTVN